MNLTKTPARPAPPGHPRTVEAASGASSRGFGHHGLPSMARLSEAVFIAEISRGYLGRSPAHGAQLRIGIPALRTRLESRGGLTQ